MPQFTRHLLQPRPYPARLSIVIPCYNEEQVIPFLRARMGAFLPELRCDTEIVAVNDGSTDRTLDALVEWARSDPRIKVLHLSRNFGHQAAATAGLDRAAGYAVVLTDADLQDPPAVIHDMIGRYCEGYDVVYGQREARAGETVLKRFTAWAFYRLMRLLVYPDLPLDTGDFRLISRACLEQLSSMREYHRFLRGMVTWVGYPQIAVRYPRANRVAGRTKYPLCKMLRFAWTAATSFSTLPLNVTFGLGLLTGAFGIEEAVRALLARMLGWYTVAGWTSLTVLVSLIGSSLLISMGLLGQYVGRIYEQSKDRPLYIVARTFNVADAGTPEGGAARAHAAGQS